MKESGFKPHDGRLIDYDKNNKAILSYLQRMEASFSLCIGCGACAATCTAANFTDFSLRKIIAFIRLGENDEVRREIDKCMLCGKCTLVCPRGVSTRSVVFYLREAFDKLDNYAV